MVWRLTLLAACLALAVLAEANPALAQADRSRRSRATRVTTHSVYWDAVALGDVIERIHRAASADILVDRRVDRSRRVTLSIDQAPTEEIVEQLATECGLGVGRVASLIYFGPQDVAASLPGVAADRRRDAARLPESLRRSLLQRKKIAWPRLTQPRDLVARLAAEHGWKVTDAERIAFDVWPAGELPRLTLADALSVLLAGFDLTYRLDPKTATIELVPVDWSSIEAPAIAIKKPPPASTRVESKQVYTLRIQEQPVGAVLTQLAKRFGWKLTVNEDALRAAGKTMDTRVSFAVENVEADQLVDALLAPAGLRAHRHGNQVRVTPR